MLALAVSGSLLILFLIYVFVNFRETKREFQMVFTPRLIRRFFLRFSIWRLLSVTALAAVLFAVINWLELSARNWPNLIFISVVVAGGFCLCFCAYVDMFSKHARRKHPDDVDLDQVQVPETTSTDVPKRGSERR